MKVVLLAGGMGTRISEESQFKPKPMVEIGSKPILCRKYLEMARKHEGSEAVLLLGRTYEELGDFNYAISVYTSYLENDQTNASVYNRLGLCKLEMKAYEEALTAFQTGKGIENNDMMQTLRFNEIITYERLGDYKQAASLIGSYLSAYPDDETAQREYIFLKTR